MSTEDAHSDHDEGPAMELGLYTFAELTPAGGGATITPAQRLRDLMEEVELAAWNPIWEPAGPAAGTTAGQPSEQVPPTTSAVTTCE